MMPLVRLWRLQLRRRRLRERQSDDECASLPDPAAGSAHGTAMHFNQSSHKGQSDAETALCMSVSGIALREHVEYTRQHRARYSDAGVAYLDYSVAGFRPRFDRDASPRLRILCRIVEQVGKHLRESHGVGVQRDRLT